MKEFSPDSFTEFVIDSKIVGVFDAPITLKSGRLSHWYVNWRTALEDAWSLEQVVHFTLAFAHHRGLAPDTFYGVPEGATKLGVALQMEWAKQQAGYGRGSHVVAMGRAKPKEHGDPKDKYFVGKPVGRTVVVEDTTTTGGSLIETLAKLREAGVDVVAAIALTNRNERRDDGYTVAQILEQQGIPYFALSNARDILPSVLDRGSAGTDLRHAIDHYFEQYGE